MQLEKTNLIETTDDSVDMVMEDHNSLLNQLSEELGHIEMFLYCDSKNKVMESCSKEGLELTFIQRLRETQNKLINLCDRIRDIGNTLKSPSPLDNL